MFLESELDSSFVVEASPEVFAGMLNPSEEIEFINDLSDRFNLDGRVFMGQILKDGTGDGTDGSEAVNSAMLLTDALDFPFELEAGQNDLALFKRICEQNPNLKLPQSNPDSYDNDSTLLRNIRTTATMALWDRMESLSILYQLIAKFLKDADQKESTSDDRIQVVLSYIRRNIDSQMDISELAVLACMSNDHFIRVFKKEVGETPMNYITRKKIEKAELLLTTKSSSVKSIAYSLGYDDHSYFNRLFKSRVGKTPQQYREATKK